MWTTQLEKEIEYIGNCSRGYLWMYREDSRFFSKVYQIISTLTIVSSVFGSSLGVVGVGLGASEHQTIIVVGVLFSFIVAVSEGLIRKMNLQVRSNDLKRQSVKFSGLVSNIKRQLSIPSPQREDAMRYHSWISKMYDELVKNSMDLTERVQAKYDKIAKEYKLPIPGDLSDLSSIKIYNNQSEHDVQTHQEPRDPFQTPQEPQKSPSELEDLDKNIFLNSPVHGSMLEDTQRFSDDRMEYELRRLSQS